MILVCPHGEAKVRRRLKVVGDRATRLFLRGPWRTDVGTQRLLLGPQPTDVAMRVSATGAVDTGASEAQPSDTDVAHVAVGPGVVTVVACAALRCRASVEAPEARQ